MLCEDDGINSDISFSSMDHLAHASCCDMDSDVIPVREDNNVEDDSDGKPEKDSDSDMDFEDVAEKVLLFNWGAFEATVVPPCKRWCHSSRLKMREKDHGNPIKFCDKLFYWQAHLRFHVESKHPEKVDTSSKDADDEAKSKKNLMCTICSKTFATLKFLKKHVSRNLMKTSHTIVQLVIELTGSK
ncbi:uncharacterized protein LOC116620252 isoform X2 [Nematostella vectensis]|uniref:uncharacterized protein LOC116620252 isoform X2 n=1 Tax=Nematostella vectensis TaxID=45351 RepID=UPI0020775F44|nr:uncharacterized protein LOC116620252 isoform X2 [Nematostella vectensis]